MIYPSTTRIKRKNKKGVLVYTGEERFYRVVAHHGATTRGFIYA
jgi:hypothetical protein